MAYKIFAIFFFLPLLDRGAAVTMADYCKISSKHTVCKTKCERSSACGITGEGFKVLSDEDRNFVLNEHNNLRQQIASGGLTAKGFPAASNMNVLNYDKEMEFIAGCWIKQCDWNHDKDRRDSKGVAAGQNLGFNSFSRKLKMDNAWLKERIVHWFDEYKLFKTKADAAAVVAGTRTVKFTGHFTAMCWAETKYVGCAKLYSIRTKGMHRYDLYCNYKPHGNMKNAPMYLTTPPKGGCDKATNYSSLCGQIRSMSEDTYKAPMNLNLATRITSFASIFAWLITVLLALLMI